MLLLHTMYPLLLTLIVPGAVTLGFLVGRCYQAKIQQNHEKEAAEMAKCAERWEEKTA